MIINALYAAKPQPFGPRQAPSSIIKMPVPSLTVSATGTLEDEQGNKNLHGGPEKVLHQYSTNSYALLAKTYTEQANKFKPGSIGENIQINDMDDTNVMLGDVYRLGGVIVQVSAPRAPCNKIAFRYDIKGIEQFIAKNGITGWYYRVLESGTMHTGDEVHHLERKADSVSIHELVMNAFGASDDIEQLQRISQLSTVDKEWRDKCGVQRKLLERLSQT